MSDLWQITLVVIIEILAVAFLVSRLWPRRPRASKKPDVPTSRLLRKNKPSCH